MKISRTRAAVAVVLALALVACGTDVAPTALKPVQPTALVAHAPSGDLLGLPVPINLPLLSLFGCHTDGFGSMTRDIGPEGGTLRVGPHTLVIPRGALSRTTRITMTGPAGNHVGATFEPEGLKFNTAATLTVSYRYCNVLPQIFAKIVYVNDDFKILDLLPSLGDLLHETVTAPVKHFSGYFMAE